jgi:hypothetical protein
MIHWLTAGYPLNSIHIQYLRFHNCEDLCCGQIKTQQGLVLLKSELSCGYVWGKNDAYVHVSATEQTCCLEWSVCPCMCNCTNMLPGNSNSCIARKDVFPICFSDRCFLFASFQWWDPVNSLLSYKFYVHSCENLKSHRDVISYKKLFNIM